MYSFSSNDLWQQREHAFQGVDFSCLLHHGQPCMYYYLCLHHSKISLENKGFKKLHYIYGIGIPEL